MRFLIQRVRSARVEVAGESVGEIGRGFLVFVGISKSDDRDTADRMLDKLLKLRIFEDGDGKTNRSVRDVGGSLLIVSQFTLYADCRRGNRPSFTDAGDPDAARGLYEYLIETASASNIPVASGRFGADMDVFLTNDGPFTVWMDSEELFATRK